MPPHLPTVEACEQPRQTSRALNAWTRLGLLSLALGLLVVFGFALWLNPYTEDGQARRLGTHLQTGLPPCTFRLATGMPCPSCGMTTSFALLVRGDVENSLRANAVGTLLALFWLVLIPWSLACAVGRRFFFITSVERALLWVVLVFVIFLIVRWGVVLGLGWWNGNIFDS